MRNTVSPEKLPWLNRLRGDVASGLAGAQDYRDYTSVGGGKTPDAKTMGRWGLAVDPDTIRQIHDRIVQIAQQQGLTHGRRMRVDKTVVETNIHHPTDSTLLGNGVRVLIRTMKKITAITGVVGTKLRDRSRSVKLRLLDISRIARAKGQLNHERLKKGYRRLLNSTSGVVGQARRFSHEIATGVKRARGILKRLALSFLSLEEAGNPESAKDSVRYPEAWAAGRSTSRK